MKNMVWKLLRKNISAGQIAGYAVANLIGLAIVIGAVKFYTDISSTWHNEDSFIKKDFLIISKKVSVLNTAGVSRNSTDFSPEDIAELESQPWVRKVGRFSSANFNIMAALDIEGRETLRKIIARSMDDERTLILSTHTVDEFSHLYDGAIILTHSHLTYAGTEEQVSSRLAFTVTRIAPDDALYSEVQMGRILNIEPASPDDEPTRVDWKLLYIALHSQAAQQILLTLTQKPKAQ